MAGSGRWRSSGYRSLSNRSGDGSSGTRMFFGSVELALQKKWRRAVLVAEEGDCSEAEERTKLLHGGRPWHP